MFLPERLDLDIHARRQIELHQRVHRLLRRLENIEQTLVCADLKLLRATSCPRAANAARNTCSSSWAVESGRQSARPSVAPFRTISPVD
mgnify:CR=1 FL=1